jgi:hypothetical protein
MDSGEAPAPKTAATPSAFRVRSSSGVMTDPPTTTAVSLFRSANSFISSGTCSRYSQEWTEMPMTSASSSSLTATKRSGVLNFPR